MMSVYSVIFNRNKGILLVLKPEDSSAIQNMLVTSIFPPMYFKNIKAPFL